MVLGEDANCDANGRLCIGSYWGDVDAWDWELVFACEGVLSWAEVGVDDYDLWFMYYDL